MVKTSVEAVCHVHWLKCNDAFYYFFSLGGNCEEGCFGKYGDVVAFVLGRKYYETKSKKIILSFLEQ